jgi:hypothetical protein
LINNNGRTDEMTQRTYTITNSERASAACPQRWLLRYGFGLRPIGRTRVLDLGTLVHSGLEGYFGPQEDRLGAAFSEIDRTHGNELARALSAAETDRLNAAAYIDPSSLESLAEDVATAKTLLVGYHERWKDEPLDVIENERTLSARIRTTGKQRGAHRISYSGKIDKVARINGRLFIIEHKTTSSTQDWIEKNRRSPQAVGYAYLLRENGIDVDGVVFDLVQSKPPKTPEALPVLKDGKRLAKTAGLPWTTADNFLRAIQDLGALLTGHPGKLSDCEWYGETHEALRARDESGFWYRREVELFSEESIDRLGRELYSSGTKMRAWRDSILESSEKIREAGTSPRLGEVVSEALYRHGSTFVREPSLCWQYNRLCSYASICLSWSPEDVIGFAVDLSKDGHSELSETTTT